MQKIIIYVSVYLIMEFEIPQQIWKVPFKGQLISKCIYGILNSPKKLTKKLNFTTTVPQVKLFLFVFLENWRHQKDISKLTDLYQKKPLFPVERKVLNDCIQGFYNLYLRFLKKNCSFLAVHTQWTSHNKPRMQFIMVWQKTVCSWKCNNGFSKNAWCVVIWQRSIF